MSDNDDLSNRGKEKTKTDAALTEELCVFLTLQHMIQ
jgi:hypothetical protein